MIHREGWQQENPDNWLLGKDPWGFLGDEQRFKSI
jgi:hypothetical protein